MARPAHGQVVERRTSGRRGFALRFQAYGRRRYLSLASGTSRSQAEEELANVLADVRRGVWRLPEPETSLVERPPDPTFHEFASRWYAETVAEWRQSTRADYLWQLEKHLLPFFAAHRLSEITVAEVDRYRHEKVAQATLSATSINKTITRLGQVLEVAVERELIARNPARVGGKRRRLKVTRPRRSYLDRADQIAALLDAAGQLDAEAASNRGHGRRALLATLTFGGLRIGEALALDWRDVDLAGGRLTVRTSKTDAGVRTVDLVAVLRDELLANRARAGDVDPEAPVFPSAAGRRHDRNHVRNRVLAPAVTRANERRSHDHVAPLPEGLTLHALRRTCASVLVALGRDPAVRDGPARPHRPADDAGDLRAGHAGLRRGPRTAAGARRGESLGTKRHWKPPNAQSGNQRIHAPGRIRTCGLSLRSWTPSRGPEGRNCLQTQGFRPSSP